MNLTADQAKAIDMAVRSLTNKRPLFRLAGYAGTGKTTVARMIVERVPGAAVCAFTGKAACRLREKGLPDATTIHRTIYNYDSDEQVFHLKPEVDCAYFLIDEGSMVSRELWADLQRFRKPIVLLGDPGQLEPVGGDPKLMEDHDVCLNEIHRQEEGSGIVDFATDIRLGRAMHNVGFAMENPNYSDVKIEYSRASLEDLLSAGIVICGFNRTRMRINQLIRKHRGYTIGTINPGEQIIVLKNNHELGVFNGQILTVQAIVDEADELAILIAAVTDDKEVLHLPCWRAQFGADKLQWDPDAQHYVFADYGYCVTCHRSQGSEWDRVTVIDEQCRRLWEPARWRYTAITRAAKHLNYYFTEN